MKISILLKALFLIVLAAMVAWSPEPGVRPTRWSRWRRRISWRWWWIRFPRRWGWISRRWRWYYGGTAVEATTAAITAVAAATAADTARRRISRRRHYGGYTAADTGDTRVTAGDGVPDGASESAFGWGGYWPGYSYDYGYAPAWPVPYYPNPYYYYAAPARICCGGGLACRRPTYLAGLPAKRAARQRARTDIARRRMSYTATSVALTNASYRSSTSRDRPEVKTVIRALQGMPPSARQAQLSRYTRLVTWRGDLVSGRRRARELM